MPVMHAALDMMAPRMSVRPEVFSTKREKMTATAATTIAIVLYSVFMKVPAPDLMIPAISAISAVPSSIALTFL